MREISIISQLFSYPTTDFRSGIDDLSQLIKDYGEETANLFIPVADHFSSKQISELQEYYIRTFDVSAQCYLDIGYVLFGEDSKRGQFLLNIQAEQRKVNNDCGKEFPDHLPNILNLLPKIDDTLFREELCVTILAPALKIMIENFSNHDNCYRNLLSILLTIIEKTWEHSSFEPYKVSKGSKDCMSAYACGEEYTKLSDKKFKN